jgi:hypothetical protein
LLRGDFLVFLDGGGWWRMVEDGGVHPPHYFTLYCITINNILYNISISGGLEDRI